MQETNTCPVGILSKIKDKKEGQGKKPDSKKEIELVLEPMQVLPNQEIRGTVLINYKGRYDGVVINTQILGSSKLITYKSNNRKEISYNVARLFMPKENLVSENKGEFTAMIEDDGEQDHDTQQNSQEKTKLDKAEYEVKFRASIIQEHKEIESDVVFAKLSRN